MTSRESRQPTLRDAKVVLRPWEPADAGTVLATCQDEQIQRWTTVPVPYEPQHAEGYVGPVASGAWQAGGAVFAVVDAATGEVVGSIGSHEVRDGSPRSATGPRRRVAVGG